MRDDGPIIRTTSSGVLIAMIPEDPRRGNAAEAARRGLATPEARAEIRRDERRKRGRKPQIISFGLLRYWAENIPIMPVYAEYRNADREDGRRSGFTTAAAFRDTADEQCYGYEYDWRCWTYRPTPERAEERPWRGEPPCMRCVRNDGARPV